MNKIIFLDAVGRVILGEVAAETEAHIQVKNPSVINVVQTPPQIAGGAPGMAVQILPLIFREFLADKSESSTWSYNKSQITVSDIKTLDVRLQKQYDQIFYGDNVFITPGSSVGANTESRGSDKSEPKIIDLFN